MTTNERRLINRVTDLYYRGMFTVDASYLFKYHKTRKSKKYTRTTAKKFISMVANHEDLNFSVTAISNSIATNYVYFYMDSNNYPVRITVF